LQKNQFKSDYAQYWNTEFLDDEDTPISSQQVHLEDSEILEFDKHGYGNFNTYKKNIIDYVKKNIGMFAATQLLFEKTSTGHMASIKCFKITILDKKYV